jgi:hypothetical protein
VPLELKAELEAPLVDERGKGVYQQHQNLTDSLVFRVNPLVANKGRFNRIFADSVNINCEEGELRIYKSKSR